MSLVTVIIPYKNNLSYLFLALESVFLQSYKILTGTMLSVFVPQNCGDHVCTLTENVENDEIRFWELADKYLDAEYTYTPKV